MIGLVTEINLAGACPVFSKRCGNDALKSIRRIQRHVPILMITGYESSDVAAQAIRLGASDYLTKPFERESVWGKVETLLNLPRKG